MFIEKLFPEVPLIPDRTKISARRDRHLVLVNSVNSENLRHKYIVPLHQQTRPEIYVEMNGEPLIKPFKLSPGFFSNHCGGERRQVSVSPPFQHCLYEINPAPKPYRRRIGTNGVVVESIGKQP